MTVIAIISTYLAIVNLIGFIIMGIDKYRAKKKEWRVPEATLFAFAVFGGSLGTTLGMFLFHHKTRHWYFVVGMPLILILQIVLSYFLVHSLSISII